MTALTQSQIENYRPEWIREDFVDFVLGQLNPLWSLRRVKARVERVELIADGMAKLTLIPMAIFRAMLRANTFWSVSRLMASPISAAILWSVRQKKANCASR